uniref:hypothetical protein n=1 Tax=Brachybacterium sp. GPGPB12 TaxID=3023517 RepID=UPI00404924C6
MIPEIAEAIASSPARKGIITNLSVGAQEAEGMTSLDMLDAARPRGGLPLRRPRRRSDHPRGRPRPRRGGAGAGARTLLRQVSVGDGTPRHDPVRLAAAYRDLFDDAYGDVERGDDRSASRRKRPHRTTRGMDTRTEEDTHGADG